MLNNNNCRRQDIRIRAKVLKDKSKTLSNRINEYNSKLYYILTLYYLYYADVNHLIIAREVGK